MGKDKQVDAEQEQVDPDKLVQTLTDMIVDILHLMGSELVTTTPSESIVARLDEQRKRLERELGVTVNQRDYEVLSALSPLEDHNREGTVLDAIIDKVSGRLETKVEARLGKVFDAYVSGHDAGYKAGMRAGLYLKQSLTGDTGGCCGKHH